MYIQRASSTFWLFIRKRQYIFFKIDSYPLSRLTIHQKHLWEPPLCMIMWFQKIAYLTLMDDEASSEIDLNI